MGTQEAVIERVRKMVEESSKIVVLTGIGTVIESGGENIWSSRECYRLEGLYHKTPDEMMNVGFYNARKDKFFEFYKKEIINKEYEPASLYADIKRLEDQGKLKMLITQNYYALAEKAGIKNVIQLHGDVHNNWCPHCGKKFTVEYMRNAKAVPLCDECDSAIRPGIRLFGENIANNLMTEAVNACEDADMILALGTNMYDNMVKFCTGNYKGGKLVLITKEEHFMDKYADYVIHDTVCEALPKIIAG